MEEELTPMWDMQELKELIEAFPERSIQGSSEEAIMMDV